MKKIFLAVTAALACTGFMASDAALRQVTNNSFAAGEQVQYRIHWGFIDAGDATVDVDSDFYKVNDRVCYRVNVFGQTTGAAKLIIHVRNTYRSYIDTAAIIPHHFYVNIQEGKYRKEERVYFDQAAHRVKSEEKEDKKEFATPQDVQDLVSGYYFLRTVDFNKLSIGDTVRVNAFFDDKFYDFKIRYRGKGDVKTRFGRIKVIKITPVMPPNKLFDGDSSIRIWISDDSNKIPVKVEADMFVGAIEVDLKSYKGLKAEPKFY